MTDNPKTLLQKIQEVACGKNDITINEASTISGGAREEFIEYFGRDGVGDLDDFKRMFVEKTLYPIFILRRSDIKEMDNVFLSNVERIIVDVESLVVNKPEITGYIKVLKKDVKKLNDDAIDYNRKWMKMSESEQAYKKSVVRILKKWKPTSNITLDSLYNKR